MATKKRRFLRLLPGRIHKFKIKANIFGSGKSAWSDVLPIRTSDIAAIGWSVGDISAKPKFWLRHIRVSWAPIGQPLRFSHYLLFRYNETDEPLGLGGLDDAITASGVAIDNLTYEANTHFLKDTGRFTVYIDKIYESEDNTNDDGAIDPLDATDNNALTEKTYHYWVWAVDRNDTRSSNYLGPDTATFGPPNQPEIITPFFDSDNDPTTSQPLYDTDIYSAFGIAADNTDFFNTEVKSINKWWCDVQIAWQCIGGAEHYLIQHRKRVEIGSPIQRLWSFPQRFDHDDNIALSFAQPPPEGYGLPGIQTCIVHNLQTDVDYEFRVKAVNVPVVLVSPPSPTGYYRTLKDPYPPPEVQNVSAKRMRHLGIRKGEHIKLTWDRPTLAIMREQIDHYRIYKLKGTDAEALAVTTAINSATETAADEWLIRENKDLVPTVLKVLTTFFIDENITEIVAGGEGTGYSYCFFEGATESEQTTLYVNGTSVSGTLVDASISQARVYEGDNSMLVPAGGGNNGIQWNSADILDLDEGYISFWWNPDDMGTASTWDLFQSNGYFTSAQNYIKILHFQEDYPNNYSLWVIRRANGVTANIIIPSAFLRFVDRDTWIHIEVRWSIVQNIFQAKVKDGSWVNYTSGSFVAKSADDTGIFFGGESYQNWFDKLEIYKSPDAVSLQSYYHYWVTAIDVDNKESVVSQSGVTIVKADDDRYDGDPGTGESYDKVSFDRPAAAVLVSPLTDSAPGINQVTVFGVPLYTIKLVWEDVEEATYYKVKLRFTPEGKSATTFHQSARLDQSRVALDGVNPFWVYPLGLQYKTYVEWYVISGNMAGETESAKGDFTIQGDTTPPDTVLWHSGDCKGINALTEVDEKKWMAVTLKWYARPNSEMMGGDYKIYQDGTSEAHLLETYNHNFFAGIAGTVMTKNYLFPGKGDFHDYYIRAVDAKGIEGLMSAALRVNHEVWWQF